MALGHLSMALREVRWLEEAISTYQDEGMTFRETGDRHREGIALDNIEIARAAQEA